MHSSADRMDEVEPRQPAQPDLEVGAGKAARRRPGTGNPAPTPHQRDGELDRDAPAPCRAWPATAHSALEHRRQSDDEQRVEDLRLPGRHQIAADLRGRCCGRQTGSATLPACSNSVQNTTLKTISTIAATIIWNSTLLPRAHDQIGMPMTATDEGAEQHLAEHRQRREIADEAGAALAARRQLRRCPSGCEQEPGHRDGSERADHDQQRSRSGRCRPAARHSRSSRPPSNWISAQATAACRPRPARSPPTSRTTPPAAARRTGDRRARG